MQYHLQIPEPCHESWEGMTPKDNGRHCAQCCKTVVDFSAMQQHEIQDYIATQGDNKICGRFRTEQLNTSLHTAEFTYSVSRTSMPFYKKIAAVILFALGLLSLSLDSEAQVGAPKQTTHKTDSIGGNPNHNMIQGGLAAPNFNQQHQQQKKPVIKLADKPAHLTGKIIKKPIPVQQPTTQHTSGMVQTIPQKKAQKAPANEPKYINGEVMVPDPALYIKKDTGHAKGHVTTYK